jgi:glycosyltransferase involved in cell wall biosynthesis
VRVALVTGSLPPEPCGVGAYVERLAESLRACEVDAQVVHGADWSARGVRSVRRRVDALEPDLTHIQYPTLGYGARLGPHVLSVVRPGIVTLHELRHTHVLRKLTVAAFAASAHHVVCTTESEQAYLLRFAPRLRGRSSVIPVGTSIPRARSLPDSHRTEVVHFGLIRPEKGLEQVIELAEVIDRRKSELAVRIVGDVPPRCNNYFRELKASTAGLPVSWEIGLPPSGVADLLAGSLVGYLPFPDGASERRTSLLALLDAGVATITTRGSDTPAALAGTVRFAETPAEALDVAETLVAERAAADALRSQARRYMQRFSWDRIAATHRALYEDVLHRRLEPRSSRRPGPGKRGWGRG